MATYRVYAEDVIDKTRRYLGDAVGDNIGKGLFDLYSDQCGDQEEVVLVPTDTAADIGRKGGLVKSDRKTATARENGKKGGRPGMYTVTLTDESGDTTSWPELTKRAAITLAKETAAFNPTCAVFIEWYRKSDGQHGYLNPSGDHEVTGHAW